MTQFGYTMVTHSCPIFCSIICFDWLNSFSPAPFKFAWETVCEAISWPFWAADLKVPQLGFHPINKNWKDPLNPY